VVIKASTIFFYQDTVSRCGNIPQDKERNLPAQDRVVDETSKMVSYLFSLQAPITYGGITDSGFGEVVNKASFARVATFVIVRNNIGWGTSFGAQER